VPDTALPGSSLAARCTACSTVFRVVPDQLRVSEGWVRCGRCSQVFNAAENLIDLETGAPRRLELGSSRPELRQPPGGMSNPPVPASAPSHAPSFGPHSAAGSATAFTPTRAEPAQAPPAPDSSWPDSAMAATQPLYGPPDSPPTRAEPISAAPISTDADPTPRERAPDPPAATVSASETAPPGPADAGGPVPQANTAPTPTASEPALPLPSFVRSADRAARWRQPRVRAALASASVCAALLLVAQWVHTYRDSAAARWPGLRPALEAGCQVLGCRVGPAKSIEALTVESSGLLRVEQTRLYQLTVSLRNRAMIDLAVPALELSLTDAQGRLLSRRVLQPAELGVAQPTVGAGRDLALQATLQTAPLSTGADSEELVVGYTIELFYP